MIHVCSLDVVAAEAERLRPRHLVSLVDPDFSMTCPECIDPEAHVRFAFHDIGMPVPGQVAPSEDDIARLLAFGERWNGGASVLIHCHAAISRSPAAAFILLCQANPGCEQEAAALLRRRAPHARPNGLMVDFADRLLGCGGRMIEALGAMPPPSAILCERLVSLPARL